MVCQIVTNICIAIVQKLAPAHMHINFPTGDGLKELAKCLKNKWGVLQYAQSTNHSYVHVPVTPPATNHTYYYNHKGWHLILVQAVMDRNCLFQGQVYWMA